MNRPRVLIDTNVLLSGLIWDGNEARLLELSACGAIHLLIPEFVLGEARRVLERKFPAHAGLLDSAVAALDYEILPRPADECLAMARQTLRDVNDAEVLASIVESQPDFAVTGDKDLLTPEVQSIFPTSRCRDFLNKISE